MLRGSWALKHRSHTQTLPIAVYDGLVPVTFPLPVLLSSTLSIINLDSSPLFPLSTLLISFPSLLSSHLLVPFSPLTSFSPASSPSLLLSLLVSFHLDFLLLSPFVFLFLSLLSSALDPTPLSLYVVFAPLMPPSVSEALHKCFILSPPLRFQRVQILIND